MDFHMQKGVKGKSELAKDTKNNTIISYFQKEMIINKLCMELFTSST